MELGRGVFNARAHKRVPRGGVKRAGVPLPVDSSPPSLVDQARTCTSLSVRAHPPRHDPRRPNSLPYHSLLRPGERSARLLKVSRRMWSSPLRNFLSAAVCTADTVEPSHDAEDAENAKDAKDTVSRLQCTKDTEAAEDVKGEAAREEREG